jgi:Rieske Fe-S protein
MATPANPLPSPQERLDERRKFTRRAWAVACGSLALVVPVVGGLLTWFDPLRRSAGRGQFVPVAPLADLPDDGVPHEFPVIAERVDAWNRSVEPIGAVYLRRQPGEAKIECLTAICPHAGCFISYDKSDKKFKCPCHNSEFTVEGQIIQPSPSPRPMDSLACEVLQDEIRVKFEDFYSGRAEKVAKG